MNSNRPSLLLDLGGVLVGADHARAIDAFSSRTGLGAADIKLRIYDSGLSARFEVGEMDAAEFRSSVCAELGATIPGDQFDRAWCKTLYELDDIGNLLSKLGRDFKLFLLSNTNSIHFEAVRSMCPAWIELFRGFHLSYETGLKKPSREYFETALKRFSLDPKKCVFLDDSPENIAGAQTIGIPGHRVGGNGLTTEQLESWGLLRTS